MYVGGQPLTLAVQTDAAFDTTYGRMGPIWVGILGSILSAVLALTVWLLQSGRGRAEALADAMTQDLQQANKAAETALREQAAILSTLKQFSIVCVAGPDGSIREVNDLYCELSGYSAAELIGQNPRILSSGKHEGFFWVEVWQTLLHGDPWIGQVCNRSKSGQLYWVQTVIAPLRGADGAVEKYISFGYDITESRNIQDEMAANAERYNLAIDGGNDGLWDWMNVHSQEEWWSPQFYRLLGYHPNEIPADLVTFDAMLHPDYQQSTFAALEDALRNNKPFDLEYPLRTKSGEYRWFRGRAKVFFDEFGSATRMAGSIQDIHDRKMAEARLHERSEQMGAIFSLSPDGFVSFDEQGRVAYCSPAFDALVGMPGQWAVGMMEDEFSHHLFQLAVPGQLVRSLTDVRQHAGRVVLEMKPPAKHMLEVRLSRGEGTAVSQVMAIRDVTHETEVDQMKSAFLSMAAHELRTPMASIYGFTELLLTRELKPERQKDLLGRIYRQSEAMSGIINELLDLARIESRRGKDFALRSEDLTDLVAEVIQDFKTPEGREAPGVLANSHGHVTVWVDRKKMQQAVLNILSNAYKYSPQGGAVEVTFVARMLEGRPQCGVVIQDHGMGLSPDQLARVGERFYRADKSGNIPGTGLGVTIVKEIMELMGGAVDITSELGVGTCVTLWVPQLDLSKVEPVVSTEL
ncbi:MAG: PAS domain-containing protein [Acidobacteriota bacterium]